MDKEVTITMETTQIADGESHTIRFVHNGQHYLKNGQHYVFYEEDVEGSKEKIKNRITFHERGMQVSKKGALTSEMYFEAGKSCEVLYQTPFGEMLMYVQTHTYSLEIKKEDEIFLTVNYDLGAKDGQIAECHIKIQIQPM